MRFRDLPIGSSFRFASAVNWPPGDALYVKTGPQLYRDMPPVMFPGSDKIINHRVVTDLIDVSMCDPKHDEVTRCQ